MTKIGDRYVALNDEAIRALEQRLSPRAQEAARQMFAPPTPPKRANTQASESATVSEPSSE